MRDTVLFSGGFGLERETLRVDSSGRMAMTPHPFDDPHLTRDFCENQLEIITPVCSSVHEVVESLAELDSRARQELSKRGERIWLCSDPPHFETEDDIRIADFSGSQSSKRSYREKLQQRYGKRLMLYSGIHFNYSLSSQLLERFYNESGSEQSLSDFRDSLYLRLKKQLMRYSWLIVLLTSASPVYDRSLIEDHARGAVFTGEASLRNSSKGYWNHFVPVLDYSSLTAYTDSIRQYIDKGVLFSASELYLPIRLKPRGVNSLEGLARNGIDHLELRMFDLDPRYPLGVSEEDLSFAQILILYLLSLEDFDFTPALQRQAVTDHQAAAMFDLDTMTVSGAPAKEAALTALAEISAFFADDEEALAVVEAQRQKLIGTRPCQLVKELAERIGNDLYTKTGSETNV